MANLNSYQYINVFDVLYPHLRLCLCRAKANHDGACRGSCSPSFRPRVVHLGALQKRHASGSVIRSLRSSRSLEALVKTWKCLNSWISCCFACLVGFILLVSSLSAQFPFVLFDLACSLEVWNLSFPRPSYPPIPQLNPT